MKIHGSGIHAQVFLNVPSFASGLGFLMKAENLAKMSMPAVFDSGCLAASLMYLRTGITRGPSRHTLRRSTVPTASLHRVTEGARSNAAGCDTQRFGPDVSCDGDAHLGGQRTSSRNSSILLTSVLTSPLNVTNGGCVPGARFWRSAGFLEEKQPIQTDGGN